MKNKKGDYHKSMIVFFRIRLNLIEKGDPAKAMPL